MRSTMYLLPKNLQQDVTFAREGIVAKIIGYEEKTVKPPVAYGLEPGVYVDWNYPVIEMDANHEGERI